MPPATIAVAFARIATSKVFRRMWRPALTKLGVTACATVHALGEGAEWIGNSVRRVLPGCRETLDIFQTN